jgi:hypothetical protein
MIAGIGIVANQNGNAPQLNRSGESGDFLM